MYFSPLNYIFATLPNKKRIQQTEKDPTSEVVDTADEDTTEQQQTATADSSPDITNDTESETEKKMSSKELENLKIFDRLVFFVRNTA